MTVREQLISGIHHQRDALESLILKLQSSDTLSRRECSLYEARTKKIESNLKKLRRLALNELIKELTTEPYMITMREEILE